MSLSVYFLSLINNQIKSLQLPALTEVETFNRSAYLCESTLFSEVVGVKMGYGRGEPCPRYNRHRQCPFCPNVVSTEFHVCMICARVKKVRDEVGVSLFTNLCLLRGLTVKEAFGMYVNGKSVQGDNITLADQLERGLALQTIRGSWFNLLRGRRDQGNRKPAATGLGRIIH